MSGHTSIHQQQGQALAESLLVLAVLASFWLAIAWLGRIQDIRLQLLHDSRHAAFAWAHQDEHTQTPHAWVPSRTPKAGWQTRKGQALVPDGVALWLDQSTGQLRNLPGDMVAGGAEIRRDWRLGDERLWVAHAEARTAGGSAGQAELADFDQVALRLRAHTAIAVGSGAASSDALVQHTLAGSALAWGHAQQASQAVGQAVARRLGPLDAPWGRPEPQWDWLGPWAGQVPQRHLSEVLP